MALDYLKVPRYNDVPSVFFARDFKGVHQLRGPYGQLIFNFAKYMNYDFRFEYMSYEYSARLAQNRIAEGYFNLTMLPVTYSNALDNVSFSYPLEFSRYCVIVPTPDELPHFWYVVLPFGPYVWIWLNVLVVYTALAMRFFRHPTPSFVQNMLKSYAVVYACANMNLEVTNSALRLHVLYWILLLAGFIFNTFYLTYLSSYYVKPIFQPYPKTEDEIIAADLDVWASYIALEDILNYAYANISRLTPRLVHKYGPELAASLKNFSRANAFIVSHMEWDFLVRLQSNLIQPVYQRSDKCFGDMFMSYPMQLNAPFASKLDNFILQTQQAGLWEYWKEEAVQAVLFNKFWHLLYDDYPLKVLDMEYFKLIWLALGIGMGVSIVCFVLELIVHPTAKYLQRRRMTKRQEMVEEEEEA